VTVKHPEIRVSVVPEARGDFRIVDHLRKAGVPPAPSQATRLISPIGSWIESRLGL
jgi:hypothetical protein